MGTVELTEVKRVASESAEFHEREQGEKSSVTYLYQSPVVRLLPTLFSTHDASVPPQARKGCMSICDISCIDKPSRCDTCNTDCHEAT